MSHSTHTTPLQREHDRFMALSVIGREHGREAHEHAMLAMQPTQATRDAVATANIEEKRAQQQADDEAETIRNSGMARTDALYQWLNS